MSFGRVSERKSIVNVRSKCESKSKVMTCSRHINVGRIYGSLNGEQFEEVDCFKYIGLQVPEDGGCERDVVPRMNEGCRACGELKIVLSNRGLGINANKCLI